MSGAAVFRADTTSDILTASIVARHLAPDRAILLFSPDWTSGASADYLDALHVAADLHPWDEVVALPPLPVNEANRATRRRSRAAALRATRATASLLAGAVRALALDTSGQNDLFLTCLHHDDVRMVAAAFRWSSVNAYPHSLISLTRPELDQYAPFVESEQPSRSTRDRAVDAAKRLMLGAGAVPVRRIPVRRVFSFDHRAPWAQETVDIRAWLTHETLELFFDRLPAETRASVERLAGGGAAPALLLLAHDDLFRRNRALERDSYRQLTEHMVDRHGADLVLVKGHPRSHPSHARAVASSVAGDVPRVRTVAMETGSELPIELLTARTSLVAAAGIGSTALKVLRVVRDIPSYSATEAWRTLLDSEEGQRMNADSWLEDSDGYVTPIS